MSETHRARVLSIGKNVAWIVLDEESVARLATLKRTAGPRSMLVPGDAVLVRLLEEGRVLVDSIEPRSFSLERRTADGRAKTMAANVDTLVAVTSLANPPPRLAILDQLLAFAELEAIQALLVFTKPDLVAASARAELLEIYSALGYEVLAVNPKSGDTIEALRTALQGRKALLCGVSGAGKSSIFRALGGEAVIGDLSRFGLGRQTTTSARLWRMDGGFLIDSPGIAEFGLGTVLPRELAQGFREMREPGRVCRFADCTHLREPGCAVRDAVAQGRIARRRYDSYRRILDRTDDG